MNNKLKIFLGIFLTLIVLMISGAIEMSAQSVIDSIPMGLSSQLGILIISLLLIVLFSKKQIIQFNVGGVEIKKLIQPIGLALLVLITGQILSLLINTSGHPVAESLSFTQKLIIIVLLASLSEELLFRGFLLNMLSPLKPYALNLFSIKLRLPIVLSGILFGLMHFALLETGASLSFVIQIVISAMFLGVIAGYYQEKHNNFSYAFIVHMIGNLVGLLTSLP